MAANLIYLDEENFKNLTLGANSPINTYKIELICSGKRFIFMRKEKENKMTREEALNILIKRQEFDASTLKVRTSEIERKELAKNELETLEALGLIKFDEPKEKAPIEVFRDLWLKETPNTNLSAEGFVTKLNNAGVYIVNKKDFSPK